MKLNIAPLLKKHLPELLDARTSELSEADTSVRILRVFEQVLGYNPITDITHETPIKFRYADLAIKIDGNLEFIVEVKPGVAKLSLRFIDQGNWYAANTAIHWMLLTNGVDWNLYHLTWDQAVGIKSDLVFAITLTQETLVKCAGCLAILHRTSVKNKYHEAFWKKKSALNASSLGQMLLSEDVIRLLRRKVWQKDKLSVELDDVAEAVHCLFSDDVKQLIGPSKIRRPKPSPPDKVGPATAVQSPGIPKETPSQAQSPPG